MSLLKLSAAECGIAETKVKYYPIFVQIHVHVSKHSVNTLRGVINPPLAHTETLYMYITAVLFA